VTSSVLGPYGAPFRKISGALYLMSALLVVLPIIDFATSIIPYLPGSTKWRFASSSLFTGFLLTPLLGVALAMLVAGLMQHRFVLRWIAILSLLVALFLVGVSALLALDIIELRAVAEPEVKMAVILSGARAIAKNFILAFSLVFIGIACRSATLTMEPPRSATPMAPIVGAPRR
jgi:hypothetical protein